MFIKIPVDSQLGKLRNSEFKETLATKTEKECMVYFTLKLDEHNEIGKGDLWLDFNKLSEERQINGKVTLITKDGNASMNVGEIQLSYAWEIEEVLSLNQTSD